MGNFDDVLERAYQQSYLAFLTLLSRHPRIRLALHYSGSLLQWIGSAHPEYFDILRELVARNQIEIVGGGFYEPILISIPVADRLAQIRKLAEYIEQNFGRAPSGAWLAERIWEPQLPSTLAAAGVGYTLVDDTHFIAAGFEPSQLFRHYVAEDLGATVKLIPGLKKLRYLIPFDSPENNIAFLKESAALHPGGCAAMGDDLEKFGLWPETYKHCYTDGWLEKFFTALEENAEWLATVPPGEHLESHSPAGRADLPAASYAEMLEWALPTPVRRRFHAVLAEFASRPEVTEFLRGGTWRGFFMKYSEANLLHKKMLHVSAKVAQMNAQSSQAAAQRSASEHLHRSQCNDAYWHGVFGGIYAPHLRTTLWRDLIRAEKAADGMRYGVPTYANLARLDFDADGEEELYITTDSCAALLKPSDGATLAALDFRPSDVTLVNSMMRRVEPYHARLRDAGKDAAKGAAISIHDQLKAKEPGLEKRLRYDLWPRNAFRLLLFAPAKTFAEFESLQLEPSAAFAGSRYQVTSASADKVVCELDAPLAAEMAATASGSPAESLRVLKKFVLARTDRGFSLKYEIHLVSQSSRPLPLRVGLELILNLLAPNNDDRYFRSGARRERLAWAGEWPAGPLGLLDEWQNVAIQIEAPGAESYWIAPVETVSESEDGFERVYQGSQILPNWNVELAAHDEWRAAVSLHVFPART